MKTPREVLLKRHQPVEPKLDRVWDETLAPALRQGGDSVRSNVLIAIGWKMWRELVLPSRRIWACLAGAWVVIVVLNLASYEPARRVASNIKPPSREDLRALLEQRQMLAQLIGPLSEPVSMRKRTSPGPRSERAAQTSVA